MPVRQLSETERWILANQYAILEKVDPENAENHARARDALENGYESDYHQLSEHIYEGEDVMTEGECQEVSDTLEMYRRLQRSYDQLDDKSGIDESDVIFDGYDGNNDTKFLRYARYDCEEAVLPRYDDLRKGSDGWNSHMPTRPRYRAMLEVWRPLQARHRSRRMTSSTSSKLATYDAGEIDRPRDFIIGAVV